MDFNEYQKEAHKTALYPEDIYIFNYKDKKLFADVDKLNWVYPALGLSAETGELLNKLKKVIRDKNGQINEDTLKVLADELGDVQWYVSELANALHLNLQKVASDNIEKLTRRAKENTIKGDSRGDNK